MSQNKTPTIADLKGKFTSDDLELISSIVAAAVREANKPYEDPKRVAQQESDRKRLHDEELERLRRKQMSIDACPHRREDGTWNLHAQCNVDNSLTIVCGQCLGIFDEKHPRHNELRTYVRFSNVAYARQQ